MFKRFLAILFFAFVAALLGAYFYFVSRLEAKEAPTLVCSKINVIIEDSLAKNFISTPDIKQLVADSSLGVKLAAINTHSIERMLTQTGAISTAEAFTVYPDALDIVITQREPVVRIRTAQSDFYCDKNGFLLPVTGAKAMNLPVVTGRLPIELQMGTIENPEDAAWLGNLLTFTERVRNNAYWSEEIEQIEVEPDGNMTLYMRKRPFTIIFGSATDLDSKFKKMSVFYKTILPTEEGAGYKTVNLKYKNQIICK